MRLFTDTVCVSYLGLVVGVLTGVLNELLTSEEGIPFVVYVVAWALGGVVVGLLTLAVVRWRRGMVEGSAEALARLLVYLVAGAFLGICFSLAPIIFVSVACSVGALGPQEYPQGLVTTGRALLLMRYLIAAGLWGGALWGARRWVGWPTAGQVSRSVATPGEATRARVRSTAVWVEAGIIGAYGLFLAVKPLPRPVAVFTAEDGLEAVAFSPDGKTLAAKSHKSGIFFWDLRTGQPSPEKFPAHFEKNEALTSSRDGSLQAFSRGDSSVEIRNRATGETRVFAARVGSISSLTFSPDGRLLAVGGGEMFTPAFGLPGTGLVTFWDVARRKKLLTFKAHREPIRSMAFSPYSKLLAVASGEKDVNVWDVASLVRP